MSQAADVTAVPAPPVPPVLGLEVSLDPEVAEDLRRRSAQRAERRNNKARREQQVVDADEHCSGDGDDDDWNEVMMLQPVVATRRTINKSNNNNKDHIETVSLVADDEVDQEEGSTLRRGMPTENISQYNEEDEEEEVDDHDHDNDDDDNLSMTPPPTLPVVMVDLQRLVGYTPHDKEEWQRLQDQVKTALWGQQPQQQQQEQEQLSSDDDENKNDLVPQNDENDDDEFDRRVAQLFETGAARHADTTAQTSCQAGLTPLTSGDIDDDDDDNDDDDDDGSKSSTAAALAWAVVPYPKFVVVPPELAATTTMMQQKQATRVLSTARVWKQLCQPHDVDVVHRLLRHVRGCSRSLVWKVQMRHELRRLATACLEQKQREAQETAWREWRAVQRPAQLERLYEVRETFEQRLVLAQNVLKRLEAGRDLHVKQEMARDANKNNNNGLETMDFASTMMEFTSNWNGVGSSLVMGLPDDENNDNDDDELFMQGFDDIDDYTPIPSDDDEYQEEEAHLWGDSDDEDGLLRPSASIEHGLETDQTRSETIASTEADDVDPPSGDEGKQGNVADATATTPNPLENSTSLDQQNEQVENISQEAVEVVQPPIETMQQKHEKQREILRERLTTPKLRMAMAKVQALQDRLSRVDELLETLQEEEWADEEEGIPKDDNLDPQRQTSSDTNGSWSLLDQILAMVLGSTPPPHGDQKSAKDHAHWLQAEHKAVVQDWKAHFGHLPQFLALSSKSGNKTQHATTEDASPQRAIDQQHTSTKKNADEGASVVPACSPAPPLSAPDMRASLGIFDNDADDWELDDDEGENPNLKESKPASSPSPPKPIASLRPGGKVGLRPGGRL